MEFSDIQGYCNFHQFYLQIINHFQDDSHFVEVGAWLGHSSVFMAKSIELSDKRIKFDVIDVWEIGDYSDPPHIDIEKSLDKNLYDTFLYNIKECKVDHLINPIKNTSKEASKLYKDRSLDFVFIDADHNYDAIKEDIKCWFPKVKNGGILSGHDYNWTDVKKAVDEIFMEKNITECSGHSWLFNKNQVVSM